MGLRYVAADGAPLGVNHYQDAATNVTFPREYFLVLTATGGGARLIPTPPVCFV